MKWIIYFLSFGVSCSFACTPMTIACRSINDVPSLQSPVIGVKCERGAHKAELSTKTSIVQRRVKEFDVVPVDNTFEIVLKSENQGIEQAFDKITPQRITFRQSARRDVLQFNFRPKNNLNVLFFWEPNATKGMASFTIGDTEYDDVECNIF